MWTSVNVVGPVVRLQYLNEDRYYTEECDSLVWTSVDVVGPVVRLQYLNEDRYYREECD